MFTCFGDRLNKSVIPLPAKLKWHHSVCSNLNSFWSILSLEILILIFGFQSFILEDILKICYVMTSNIMSLHQSIQMLCHENVRNYVMTSKVRNDVINTS